MESRDHLRYAIVTLSDRASSGESEDLSGPLIAKLLEESFQCRQISYQVLPDEEMKLAAHLVTLCDEEIVDLILTTGGTGLSPRDRTPEATRRVIDREIPGIAEAIRTEGRMHTPHAMLSRAVAGLRGRTLIINLSGSPRAVQEQMAVIRPILDHALEVASGIKVSCARS
ncbi:MAG: MogA/MoaB family molybdenum cofactor biosynthesis protein [Bradymonadales bacterium]|nr:MogA/MoaB family molybdenum cofactor biosynthesis protein [Bradymonadales bacterium]